MVLGFCKLSDYLKAFVRTLHLGLTGINIQNNHSYPTSFYTSPFDLGSLGARGKLTGVGTYHPNLDEALPLTIFVVST
jgi:hypothetical protein